MLFQSLSEAMIGFTLKQVYVFILAMTVFSHYKFCRKQANSAKMNANRG